MKNNIKTITLGCRLNFYESEVLKNYFSEKYPKEEVVIINTCSVTHEAERQSKQMVRKALRENKNAKIIVTGCAAKTSVDYFNSLDNVFQIIQNEEKYQYDKNSDNSIFEGKARAFLQIQNGCDNYCSFCIVPFTRGKCVSFPLPDILKKVDSLLANGIKEIVFSGIDITSYGKDLTSKIEFADVLEEVLKAFPHLKRIRISSIDPNGVSDKLLKIIATESRILPHFHLSIQSGDNYILKLMKRRHTREDAINLCKNIRKFRKDVVFGADFITGFPGETEEMFKNTMKLVDEADISLLHVFPYSPRNGTLASTFIQLSKEIIYKRAKLLRNKAKEKLSETLNKFVGNRVRFIIEKEEDGYFLGKTDQFLPVKIQNKQNSPHLTEVYTGVVSSIDPLKNCLIIS